MGIRPALEEDIALANVALDLIGQTQMWLGLAAEVEGKGRSADDLAYLRDAWDFRNLLLVERPNGDFGQTLMRHFLFDVYHLELLKALTTIVGPAGRRDRRQGGARKWPIMSSAPRTWWCVSATELTRVTAACRPRWMLCGPMSARCSSSTRRTRLWLRRGLRRTRTAFAPPGTTALRHVLAEATLTIPDGKFAHKGGKRGIHTEHLGYILADMQFLQRAYPGASW